jgi:hypothetical protein
MHFENELPTVNELPSGEQVGKDVLEWLTINKPDFLKPEAVDLFVSRPGIAKSRGDLEKLLANKYLCDVKADKVIKAVARATRTLKKNKLIASISRRPVRYYVFETEAKLRPQMDIKRSVFHTAEFLHTKEINQEKESPNKLTDEQVAQRFIEMPSLFGLVPNDEIKEKVRIIKASLKAKQKLLLDGKEINPVGIINDGVYFSLVFKNANNQTVIYDLVDIHLLERTNSKLFHARDSIEALNILKRATRDKRVPGLPENERITLHLHKEANCAMRSAKLEFAKDWHYEKIDEHSGRVKFTHDISINLLNFLAQFGSAIDIEDPLELKEALDIHLNSDNPYERPKLLKNLFRETLQKQKEEHNKIVENTKQIQKREVIYQRQEKLASIEHKLANGNLKPKERRTQKKKRNELRAKLR